MVNGDAGASSNSAPHAQRAQIEAEMQRLQQDARACAEKIQNFMLQEDPAQGIFYAQEIHGLRQEKLRLEVEADLLQKRLNRMALEEAP